VLIPVTAAVIAVILLGRSLDLSTTEIDEATGFNGSFEVVKSGLPVNWAVYHRPLRDGKAELAIETSDPIHGARSVKFLVHEADSTGGWRSPGLFQVPDAEEGRTYKVSLWLKNLGCSIRLHITSESVESREPRTPVTEIIGPDRTGEGEWRQFTYTYTVPSHYSNIRFEVNVVAPGTLWIDDVRIEPAQEEKDEKGHVFTIKTYKVPSENIDTVLESWEKTWKPIYTKNEHVKSCRVFTHLVDSDWTIVMIAEYESLSAIEATPKRGQEIRKEMFPDEEKWRATVAEVKGMYLEHSEDIVKEVPNLRK
jgi:hypothetical protein